MESITVGNASKIFAEFEQDNAHYLSGFRVQQYSLWQIVKWPLLLTCLKHTNNNATSGHTPAVRKRPLVMRLVRNSIIIMKELYLLLVLRNKKYPGYLFITYAADKLAVNEAGLYYNSLMDPVIDHLEQNKIPFLHYEYDLKANQPAYRTGLYDVSKIDLVKRFLKDTEIECAEFVSTVNAYFERKVLDIKITDQHVNESVQYFFFQKKIWLYIFKRHRPKRIFTSEITNTGFLAACNELGINVFEFQHGTIDKDHPKYSIQKNIIDGSIPLKPAAYVVFGASTTQTLRAHVFNDSIDIIELGKKSIEDARKLETTHNENVLLCLQPLMDQFNFELINNINDQMNQVNFTFTVKFHPLQKEEEQSRLMKIIAGNKKITLAPTNSKIHNLIASHDIVVAHASHVLEESVSLRKPAVTIGTADTPKGILEILEMPGLEKVIIPVRTGDLINLLNKFYNDIDFREMWLSEVNKYESFFYTNNYYHNIKKILSE